MYLDTRLKKRQAEIQLKRRGLIRDGVDLEAMGIIELVMDHGFDTDIYDAVDTGAEEIREDGKAYVIYEKANRTGNPAKGFDLLRVMKDKINAQRDQLFIAGFKFALGGESHVLQTRGPDDNINWLGLLTEAEKKPAEAPMEIRTAANKTISISAANVVALLIAAKSYRAAVLKYSWAAKDAMEAAVDETALFEAYEAAIGGTWPINTLFEVGA